MFARLAILLLSAMWLNAAWLEWDLNPPEEHVAGYIIITGPLKDVWLESFEVPATNQFDVSLLVSDGIVHWFALYAFDADGLTSDYSASVSYQLPQPLWLTVYARVRATGERRFFRLLEAADAVGPWLDSTNQLHISR